MGAAGWHGRLCHRVQDQAAWTSPGQRAEEVANNQIHPRGPVQDHVDLSAVRHHVSHVRTVL